MKIELTVPDYSPDVGFSYAWENGFEITATVESSGIHIQANRAGLVSLARHLLTLAQDTVPAGSHMHFDDLNSLNDGSLELVIEKV